MRRISFLLLLLGLGFVFTGCITVQRTGPDQVRLIPPYTVHLVLYNNSAEGTAHFQRAGYDNGWTSVSPGSQGDIYLRKQFGERCVYGIISYYLRYINGSTPVSTFKVEECFGRNDPYRVVRAVTITDPNTRRAKPRVDVTRHR